MPLQIRDGYTLDTTLPAFGPYPAVAVRYRRALPEDVYEYSDAFAAARGREKARPVADLLGKHLLGWDVEGADGQPLPITARTLRLLPYPVLLKLIDLVTGYGPEEAEADQKNSS